MRQRAAGTSEAARTRCRNPSRSDEHGRQGGSPRRADPLRRLRHHAHRGLGHCSTVTHMLGVRAFGTQLLCEQVIGRGVATRLVRAGRDGDAGNGCSTPNTPICSASHSPSFPAIRAADYRPPKRDDSGCTSAARAGGAGNPLPRVLGLPRRPAHGPLDRSLHAGEPTRPSTPEMAPPSAINAAIVGQDIELSLDALKHAA